MSLAAFTITSGDPLAFYPRGEWSSEHYRCGDCKYVGRAIIDSRLDEYHPGQPDYVTVCPKCTGDDLTECNYSCDRCQHAECMTDDSVCYTCAVAEELEDVSVVPRYQRAQEAAKALPSVSEFIGSMFRDLYGTRNCGECGGTGWIHSGDDCVTCSACAAATGAA